MGTFDSLLSSLGFGAADAANQEGLIARKADLGKSMVTNQAAQDTKNLNAGYEGRGVLTSGEALTGNAQLQSDTANKMSQIDIATADDTLGLQRNLQQAQAQKDVTDRSFNLQVELANRDYQQKQAQISQQAASQQRYDEAYLNSMGRNYGGG